MKTLWKNHKLLVIGFAGAAIIAILLTAHLAMATFYWPKHQDAELDGWMTIRYVARSYEVKPEALLIAIGMADHPPRRLTLQKISEMMHIPPEDLDTLLMDAIAQERAAE